MRSAGESRSFPQYVYLDGSRECHFGPRCENGCGKMGFLIKSAFWLSLVLLVIPFGDENDQPTVGAIEAFFAARALIDDMSGLCERRPQVCETGRTAFQTIGSRARESARIAYDMLGEEPNPAEIVEENTSSEVEEPFHTGAIPVPTARDSATRE